MTLCCQGVGDSMTKKKENPQPGGRPSKYKPEFVDQLIKYFNSPAITIDKDGKMTPGHFPTLARFASMIEVNKDTLIEWTKVHPEFSDAYKRAKDLQEANLIEGTLSGAYQPSFSIFTAKNVLGWRDKTEQELTGKDGAPIQHEINGALKMEPSDAYMAMLGKK